MADDSAYQGSQAFNQGSVTNESVTLNTGSLTVSKAIVDLRGIGSGTGLAINLSYAAGGQGLLGLPTGWGFGLSYVIPGQSLTAQGKTNVIDWAWSDTTGYQSGLRYVNNHGMKFESVIPPQPLPSGRPGSYSFRCRYTDGSVDYFDDPGKLVEHDDLFGNAITYYYTDQFAGPLTAMLDHIVDSFGQVVTFQYGPNVILVTTPDGSQTTINWSDQGVQSIVDPVGNVTAFTYQTASGQTVISTIQYPIGMTTQLQYVPIMYLDASGTEKSFPAVSDLYHLDAGGNLVDHTSYSFGTDSGGNTFTGYAAGYRLNSATDSLMDSNNGSYLYDVLVSRLDNQGTVRSASRVYYNYLHLPQREEHYLITPTGQVNNGFRALYTYDIDPNYHARATTYTQPITVEQFVYNDVVQDYIPLRKSTSGYDNFGQLLNSEESLYDPTQKAYVPQSSSAISYTTTAWGGELPSVESHVDLTTGDQRQVVYTLTADQKSVLSAAVQFKAASDQTWSPWKTKSWTYDPQGRSLSETVAWSPGAPVPPNSVPSATSTNSYRYDATNHTYAIASTDALGRTTTKTLNVGAPGGPVILTVLPLGQTISSEFDAIGRIVRSVDAMGNVTTTSYTVGSAGNSVSALGPTGYLVRQNFDASGRLVSVQDNGDPTLQGGQTPNRTLRSYTYNALGQVATATDELGLAVQYQYDALSRVIQKMDALGNQYDTVHADGQLYSDTLLNGIQTARSTYDGFGRIVRQETFPDPGDLTIQYTRRMDSTYDGFGRVRRSQFYSVPRSGGSPTLLQESDYSYNVEGAVVEESTTGNLGGSVTVTRTRVFELSGQAVSTTRTTTYSDKRSYTNVSDTFQYDAGEQLTAARNALGQVETYAYDDNGRMSQRVRLDGTIFTYQYDDNGQQTLLTWPGGSISYTYLANGRTASMQMGASTMRFNYTLDSSVKSIVFPDGSQQSYGLDSFSRVTSATSASGAVTRTAFDSFGRLATRQHETDTVTYQYGTVNHTLGAFVGDSLTGSNTLTRRLAFDGFGQLQSVSTVNAQGQAVVSSVYARDALGRTSGIVLSSQTSTAPAVNFTRSVGYDGLNQLTSVQTSYAGGQPGETITYVYDGNHNVLTRNLNGTQQDFTYNAIDQITSGGVRYDTNGRMIADGAGGTYSYNALDQTTSATVGGQTVNYAYNPDGSLASRVLGSQATGFYYDGGSVNAVSSTASAGSPGWTSFLLDSTARRGAYEAGAASHYVLGAGSSALLLTGTGDTAVGYDPYGAPSTDVDFGANKNFTWNQEYADPATKLVYLRSRTYHPQLMRFCTMDSLQQDNRYTFCGGDPLNLIDPSGHMDTGEIVGLVVGGIVGIVATVLTGGAAGAVAAAVFGTECVAASVGAAALAGAAGSIAGDGVNAAITHQQFTAGRAVVDILSGGVGGAVGAGLGGAAGRWAMSAALEEGLSQRAITNIGLVCSGVVGGVTGSLASAGVTSVGTGTPFFSAGTAISMLVGAAAGVGGGFLTSGAYLGKMSAKLIPVPLTDSDFDLIVPARDSVNARGNNGFDKELFAMAPQGDADYTANRFLNPEIEDNTPNRSSSYRSALTLDYTGGSQTYDTIAAHGAGNTMFASVRYNPTVDDPSGPNYVRPIKGSVLADYLVKNPSLVGGLGGEGGNNSPIKLMTCFGAFSNAQTMANALQRPVYGGYPEINRFTFTNWKLFSPK